MTQRAQFYRVRGNRQFAVLGMALSRAMTYFADHRLVAIGRPQRMTFTVAGLAVTRRLEDRFLGGYFRHRIRAVVTVFIK